MANPYLILWCDPTQNKIYSGWQKNTQAATPILKQGDEIGCEIHWVKTGEYTATMQEIAFPPSATVRLAIGSLDAAPSGGTFTITYGANTTASLAHDIEATSLQTALNGLASITAEGGVTVSKTGNQYRIIWNDAGAYATPLTANVDMLYPTSEYSAPEVRAGSASVSRVVIFKTRQSVVAGTTSFTAVAQPSITVSSIFANNWRVSISPNPKEGVFSLTVVKGPTSYTTTSIGYDADSFTVAAALNDLNVVTGETFSVIKSGDFTWDITAPSAVDSVTATSGLVGFSAMYGVLSMNTGEVEEFLAGAESADAVLEVEVDVAGEIQTLVQTRARILNDLIETSSFTLVDMGEVMPVDSVVRYDTSQSLTAPEQETARLNIGAVSLGEVEDAYDLTNQPTNNEKAAMQYSVLPSQTNPFVTLSENNPFDQSLNTTDDVDFHEIETTYLYVDGSINSTSLATGDINAENILANKIALVNTTSGNALEYNPAGDGYKVFIDSTGNLTGKYVDGGVDVGEWGLNGEEGFFLFSGSNSIGVSTGGLSLGGSTSITFPDATVQTTAFIPADYLSKAGNLSGLANVATARTNLGLGASDSPTFSDVYTSQVHLGGDSVLGGVGLTLNDGSSEMVVGATGITFPDGTTQTTAAAASGSNSVWVDASAYNWQSYTSAGGGDTAVYSEEGMSKNSYSDGSNAITIGALKIFDNISSSTLFINFGGSYSYTSGSGYPPIYAAGVYNMISLSSYSYSTLPIIGLHYVDGTGMMFRYPSTISGPVDIDLSGFGGIFPCDVRVTLNSMTNEIIAEVIVDGAPYITLVSQSDYDGSAVPSSDIWLGCSAAVNASLGTDTASSTVNKFMYKRLV